MKLYRNGQYPHLKSLETCLNQIVIDGYADDFKATGKGIQSSQRNTVYKPEEIRVVNFFRFEGNSGPDDNAILYVIETNDGAKGTLLDAYGMYANPMVGEFMSHVEEVKKNIN